MSTSVSVNESTFAQAGKVLAVHLSYASRAAQRGRTPKYPSYFMKASSSLAVSGSTVERPAGTELLAFEGEIALIIGKAARRVSVEDAWGHVGQVTAANDLGVHDMKYADKGSNIRSKSGDGYTPMGPNAWTRRTLIRPSCACRPGSTVNSPRMPTPPSCSSPSPRSLPTSPSR